MVCHIEIKLGPAEFAFDGEPDIYDARVRPLVDKVFEAFEAGRFSAKLIENTGRTAIQDASETVEPTKQNFTARTVAAKLGVTTGPELVLAAAATLAICKAALQFTRQELHAEMKAATGYYKASYGSNLSKYIGGLVKDGTLLEVGKEVYALSESASKSLGGRLA